MRLTVTEKEISAIIKFFSNSKFDYIEEDANTIMAWRENNNAIEYYYTAIFSEEGVEVTRYKYTSYDEEPIEVVFTPPKRFFGCIINGERVI